VWGSTDLTSDPKSKIAIKISIIEKINKNLYKMQPFAKLRFPSGRQVSYNQKGKVIQKKSNRKSQKPKLSTMYNNTPMRLHTVLADKMRTTVSLSYTGSIGTGATAGTYFAVYGNSFYQPYNTSQTTTTGLVLPTAGSATTNAPMGYTALTALYNQYRVRASRIKVTCTPQALADSITLAVYPSAAVTNTDIQPFRACSQRYSKWKMCTCNNNVKDNTVINYLSSNVALGLTKQQYDDYPATIIGNAPVAGQDWYWQVSYFTNSASVNSTNVVFTVELDLYLELSDLQPLQN